jgi:hypothetical protein
MRVKRERERKGEIQYRVFSTGSSSFVFEDRDYLDGQLLDPLKFAYTQNYKSIGSHYIEYYKYSCIMLQRINLFK